MQKNYGKIDSYKNLIVINAILNCCVKFSQIISKMIFSVVSGIQRKIEESWQLHLKKHFKNNEK